MSRCVLISIHPKWTDKIEKLEKRWELRTNRPSQEIPFRCYIYRTENGGVIGEFVCDRIECALPGEITKEWLDETSVTVKEALGYAGGRSLYKWRIRSLIIYPQPKRLQDFGFEHPPVSWCYLKE